jgi:hypothetical protein
MEKTRGKHWRLCGPALVGVASALAANRTAAQGIAPVVSKIDGSLWAAECVALPQADLACNSNALRVGRPGGILREGKFTILLVDGRLLAAPCEGSATVPARVQATGRLHASGAALTPVQIERWCGGDWQAVDLPYSGTAAQGAGGGDE